MNHRTSISFRLALGFVTLIGGLLVVGGWALDRLASVDRDLAAIVKERWPRIQAADRAIELMNENSRIALAIFLSDDRAEIERQIEQQERNRVAISELLAAIERTQDSAQGRMFFTAVKASRARYVDAFTRARSRLLYEAPREGRRIAVEEVLPRLGEARRAWDAYFGYESTLMNEAARASDRSYRSARRSVILVSVAGALFAALMAWGITRSLAVTFRDLERARNEAQTANRILREEMAAREKVEVELRQAQKLEAVGRLAAGVAHEINTPVQFVSDSVVFLNRATQSLIDRLGRYRDVERSAQESRPSGDAVEARQAAEGTDLDYLLENVPRAFESSLEGLDRIAAIVRSMSDFAHPDRHEMQPLDLNRAVTSTLTIAHNAYKDVADVETALGELPPIICHGGDINQAILNVVINAAHAIADVVGTSGRRGSIRIRTWLEGDVAVLAIADSGPGIPPDIQRRIFDPFFTTKMVGRGTGQGLAIARAVIVERHGGSLTFETAPGQGTTFFIRLPVRRNEAHSTSYETRTL
jgi:signal transduction histidine kinase